MFLSNFVRTNSNNYAVGYAQSKSRDLSCKSVSSRDLGTLQTSLLLKEAKCCNHAMVLFTKLQLWVLIYLQRIQIEEVSFYIYDFNVFYA